MGNSVVQDIPEIPQTPLEYSGTDEDWLGLKGERLKELLTTVCMQPWTMKIQAVYTILLSTESRIDIN